MLTSYAGIETFSFNNFAKNSLILFYEYKFHKPAYANTKIIFSAERKSFSTATNTFEIHVAATNNKYLLVSGKIICKNYKL